MIKGSAFNSRRFSEKFYEASTFAPLFVKEKWKNIVSFMVF